MCDLIDRINNLPDAKAREAFMKCCAAENWVAEMLKSIPFDDQAQLESVADSVWNSLARDDWLEAFKAHPRIGDVNSLRKKFANTKDWAEGEQTAAAQAGEDILNRLALWNDRYFEKFGYLFIVCASGKSANEMLEILESRIDNPPDTELKIAAAEQLKITLLRLQKLGNI